MFVIGIDLSGPSNSKATSVVAFQAYSKGHLTLHKSLLGADDSDILTLVNSLLSEDDIVVGIDAPLSYNIGGGDRPPDAELRKKIVAAGLRPGSVMAPTMTRMVYLTLRGIAIARLLYDLNENIHIVEVHPAATMSLRGAPINDIAALKKNEKSRRNLLTWLMNQGLKKLDTMMDPSDHYVAACACALAAWKWFQNKSVWIHPAVQPFHPFDYAC